MNSHEPRLQTRLESWKEIGAYLQRDATTARRWEKEEGLPVHRHTHKSRSSVYAYPAEIDVWRASRKVVEAAPVRRLWRWPAFAATMLLCLVMVGNGIRPVSAQQRGSVKTARQIWAGAGVDGSGTVSADGRFLSFTNWESGDLGLRDLVKGTNRLLTNSGGWEASGEYSEQSVISPNGQQVAYHWFLEKENRDELRIRPLIDGALPRTLYSGQKGRADYMLPRGWTPDGKRVLVVHSLADRTSQIALVSVEDQSVRVIKSLSWQFPSARISPDGRYVAYDLPVDPKTAARDIFVLAVDGSQETLAVRSPSDDAAPVWSPDGSRILFLSNRTGNYSLWSVSMDSGKPKGPPELVKADTGNITPLGVASNGGFYYLSPGASGNNIYAAELGAGMKAATAPVLATERFVNSNTGPSVSPDGRYLGYYSNRPSTSGVLVIRTLETGEERDIPMPLPVAALFGAGPAWFPDSGSVLVTLGDPQRPGISYYRLDLASGKQEMLLHTGQRMQGYKLSPDGTAIFYTEGDSDNTETITTRLVRFDIGTRRETELRKGEWFIELAVSPDSRQLAYLVSVRPGAASFLAVMPAAGGPAREVFRGTPWMDGSRYNALAWTGDQRYLVFARGGVAASSPNVLWRVPVTGGQPEPLGVSMPGQIRSPQMHPDGRRIFFSASRANAGEVWAMENFLTKVTAK